MASQKLARMLQQLDLSDSGGVEAAMAAAPSSQASSNPSLHSQPQHSSSYSSDTDDVDQSDVLSDRGTPKLRLAGRPKGLPLEKRHLESKVIELMTDNKALTQTVGQANRRRELEVAELQAQLSKVVKELEARQAEVESRAPLLNMRLEEFKEQLHSLRISDARYAELKAMPDESLHIIDLVKIAVHDATSKTHTHTEHLRLAASGARDASERSAQEAARMRVENARLKVGMVEKDKELSETVDSLQARVQRLASELQGTTVRAELLSAKGAMYDKLHAQAEQLRQDNQRLQVVEASFKRMEQAHHKMHLQSQETKHTNEMLVADKAYLSKQVDFLTDAQRRLQTELEAKDAQISELQNQKREIFDKMVQAETQKVKDEDRRLQKELTQLQASTHADIERIRVEARESYDREVRLLRELRDQAQEEASRAKIALAELQDTYDRQQIHATKAAKQMDMHMVELKAELKQRAFELSHIKVVLGEKEAMLQRSNLHNEMLQEKAQVGLDRCRAVEGDLAALGGKRSAIGCDDG
ncbi:hypothetical protein DUNSADRAFT_16345 [Dunaliella salina]|uniref:Uncharacterized protein n=1 Tax=Dunaliella salina TaxID=3046 RepID=A0ABQ7H120_DUNSA|nr:hypothetical protein DUNSADRAFT_16345 [Dunaliella salina]|eukprot:KAF5840547.1 hypothetical protein DUNSADRAFT_16345 [Dunaliella salina]